MENAVRRPNPRPPLRVSQSFPAVALPCPSTVPHHPHRLPPGPASLPCARELGLPRTAAGGSRRTHRRAPPPPRDALTRRRFRGGRAARTREPPPSRGRCCPRPPWCWSGPSLPPAPAGPCSVNGWPWQRASRGPRRGSRPPQHGAGRAPPPRCARRSGAGRRAFNALTRAGSSRRCRSAAGRHSPPSAPAPSRPGCVPSAGGQLRAPRGRRLPPPAAHLPSRTPRAVPKQSSFAAELLPACRVCGFVLTVRWGAAQPSPGGGCPMWARTARGCRAAERPRWTHLKLQGRKVEGLWCFRWHKCKELLFNSLKSNVMTWTQHSASPPRSFSTQPSVPGRGAGSAEVLLGETLHAGSICSSICSVSLIRF